MRAAGKIRIIGGQWRGRRLPVADQPGLRPTPDRIRETLFNWLATVIPGARCLDLFAGTGALGFEALSRGARCAIMVEQNIQLVQQLEGAKSVLEADRAEIIHTEAINWLANRHEPFNVVFLDSSVPPALCEKSLYPADKQGTLGACRARLYGDRAGRTIPGSGFAGRKTGAGGTG